MEGTEAGVPVFASARPSRWALGSETAGLIAATVEVLEIGKERHGDLHIAAPSR